VPESLQDGARQTLPAQFAVTLPILSAPVYRWRPRPPAFSGGRIQCVPWAPCQSASRWEYGSRTGLDDFTGDNRTYSEILRKNVSFELDGQATPELLSLLRPFLNVYDADQSLRHPLLPPGICCP